MIPERKTVYHSEEHRLLHEELNRITEEPPSEERTVKLQQMTEKIKQYWEKVKGS